jgi:ribonuclease Z
MAEVVLLGTGAALPAADQENTYMALIGESHIVLVDCAGSPLQRLLQAGVDISRLDRLVLTHAHPDHIYGVPSLLLSLWLAGRRLPLQIHGPEDVCEVVRAMMALYRPERWPGMYRVEYVPVALEAGSPVFNSPDFAVSAAPGQHMLPSIGLRVVSTLSGRALVYSSDTEPSLAIRNLAHGAYLLLHEAAGEGLGHSSGAQAGTLARQAGVDRLVLVHYHGGQAPAALLQEASSAFGGPVQLGQDFERFSW